MHNCVQLPIEDSLQLAASSSATATVTGTTVHEFKPIATNAVASLASSKDFSPYGGCFQADQPVLWKVTEPQTLVLQQLSAGNIRSFAISFPAPILPRPELSPTQSVNTNPTSQQNTLQLIVSLSNSAVYRFQINWLLKVVGDSSVYLVENELIAGGTVASKPTMQLLIGGGRYLLHALSDGSFSFMRLPVGQEVLPEFIHGQSPVYRLTPLNRFRPEHSLLSKIRGLVPLWSSSYTALNSSSTASGGESVSAVADSHPLSGAEILACSSLQSPLQSELFLVSLTRDKSLRLWRISTVNSSAAKAATVVTEILPVASSLIVSTAAGNQQQQQQQQSASRNDISTAPVGRVLMRIFNQQSVTGSDVISSANLLVHLPNSKETPVFLLYRIDIYVSGSASMQLQRAVPCHVLSYGLLNDSFISFEITRQNATADSEWTLFTLWRSPNESVSAVLSTRFPLAPNETAESPMSECQWFMMDSTRQSLGEHFDDFLFDEREDLSADRFLALHLSICSLKQAYDVYMGKPSSRLYNFRTADEWKQHVYREISTKARTKTENAYQSFSAAPSSEQELQERMVKNLALEWNRFQTIYHKFYRHALLGLDLALLTDSHEENTNVALVNLAGLAVIESASSIDRAYAFTSGQSDWIDIDQHMQPAMQCLRYFASLLDRPSLTNELRPYLKQTLNVSIETFAADFCERTLPNVPPFAYLQVRQIPLDSIVELSGLIVNRLKEVSGGGADGQVPFLRNDYLVQLARISNVYQNGLMMNAYLLALVCAKINTSALDSPVSALCRTVPALISNIRNCLTCLVFCKSADTKAIEHFVAFIRGCRTTATVPLALHHHQQQQQPFCLSLLTDQPPKHLLVAFIDALLKGNHWLAAESILNSNHADGWVLYLLAMLCFYRGEHGKALEYFLKFAPAITQFAKNEDDGRIAMVLVPRRNILNLFEYYLHLMELFKSKEAFEQSNICALLAIKFQQPDSSAEENDYLYSNIFQFHLSLGQFESAFNFLDNIKNLETLETSLNNLVTQMCEAGKQEALCLLPTGRWTDTIVDILEFKARNSGALAFPNYFKILYCFYTIRDDHQKAAHWMYRYAITVKHTREIGPEDSIMIQAKALLAAINSLELAPKPTAFIPNDEFILACQDETMLDRLDSNATVLDASALRRIYILLIAQLQLAPFNPQLLTQQTLINPVEAVSLCMTSGLFELAVNIARAHAIPMIALEDKLPKGLRGRRELKQINRIL